MVKLYTVQEMREVEKEANNSGLSYELMMENAGESLANEISTAYSQLPNRRILAIVGSGNNGGDALVALCHLIEDQWTGCAYIVKERAEEDPLVTRFKKSGGKVYTIGEDSELTCLAELIENNDIFVDGVFGTGIKLPLKGEIAKILLFSKNKLDARRGAIHVVSVDCPSGMDCESGEVAGETIRAEMTVTMAGLKTGMINNPSTGYLGELRIGNIGNLTNLATFNNNKKIVLTKELVYRLLPPRPLDAHKGTFGTALIIAGSVNYTGAALLSGKAAYLSGAGLVTLAVPAPLHTTLAGHFAESTWILLPHEHGGISQEAVETVNRSLKRATAVLIGPGFGLEDSTKEFIKQLISYSSVNKNDGMGLDNISATDVERLIDKPVVIDADGLKLLSKIDDWNNLLVSGAILTPHPGEMSVLTGLSTELIQSNRVDIAQKFANKWGHIVVLKGAYTIIASPDGRLAVVPIATSALARAGTGDVLAGLIVGLRAQGLGGFEAACAGSWIHANAGLLAAERIGNTASVLAGDVLEAVPSVISSLQTQYEENK